MSESVCAQGCMVLDIPLLKFGDQDSLRSFYLCFGQKFAMISFVNGFYTLMGLKD